MNETDQRLKFVGVVAMYILHFQIFRVIDKKLFKSIWDIHRKVRHWTHVSYNTPCNVTSHCAKYKNIAESR